MSWGKSLEEVQCRTFSFFLSGPRVVTKVAHLSSASRVTCDVSDKDEIANFAAYIGQQEDHLDMLISNAGIRRDPPVQCNVLTATLTELQQSMWSSRHSDWADTFRVNTTAHYFLSVALLPLLAAASSFDIGGGRLGREEGRGAVIVTSSCASMHNVTNIDLTSYATSKAGTDHLVRLLAAKFSRFYVRVVGINPGCKHNWRTAPRANKHRAQGTRANPGVWDSCPE